MALQKRTIKEIKQRVQLRAELQNKVVEEWKQEDLFDEEERSLGMKDVKVLTFTVNAPDGRWSTEVRAQLFIGPRGGVEGIVRTHGNEAKVQGRRQIRRVVMWI